MHVRKAFEGAWLSSAIPRGARSAEGATRMGRSERCWTLVPVDKLQTAHGTSCILLSLRGSMVVQNQDQVGPLSPSPHPSFFDLKYDSVGPLSCPWRYSLLRPRLVLAYRGPALQRWRFVMLLAKSCCRVAPTCTNIVTLSFAGSTGLYF